MTNNKGIDHITALFSILFIGLLSFHLVSLFPKPSHNVAACTLISCTLLKSEKITTDNPLAHKPITSVMATNIAPVTLPTISPTPAYIALIPTATPTSIPVAPSVTPTPTENIQRETPTETPPQQPATGTSEAPKSTDIVTAIITPVVSLVTRTTDLLR